MGGPNEPSTSLTLRLPPALWPTEHPAVFILYVEASCFVAEVIGQKQSLVLNWFYMGGGGVIPSVRGDVSFVALLEEVDIFGIFVLIGERRL